MIPFLDLEPSNKLPIKAFTKNLESFFSKSSFIGGEEVEAFEKIFSLYTGCKYSIGTSNGLDALVIALQSLGIGKGDEVIIPSNTFIATALAASRVQAEIILVDPDLQTWNLTVKSVENHITSKTKAIIAVNLYGLPAELTRLKAFCRNQNIILIEDNAQSHGAEINGIKTGNFGLINATSFYPGKNLGCIGDGGALTTNNKTLAVKAKKISNYGSNKKYIHEVKGGNYRLDAIQALFLNEKINHLDSQNEQRIAIANNYKSALNSLEEITFQYTPFGYKHVYHLFVIKTKRRDELMNFLKENQIQTLIHYPITIAKQKAYKEEEKLPSKFAIEFAKSILSLPCYPGMRENDQNRIIEVIHKFFKRN